MSPSTKSTNATGTLLPEPAAEDIDFAALPWNLNLPDEHSYLHISTSTGDWSEFESPNGIDELEEHVFPYGERPLPRIHPATTSLNYGTTVWEGLKAYRIVDGDDDGGAKERAVVFRCDRNYERMKRGAEEMCLPMPSRRLFMKAIQLIVRSNARLIPPATGDEDGTKLYVRPMLMGTGQQLGLYPSPEFSFLVYVSPTGSYFQSAAT